MADLKARLEEDRAMRDTSKRLVTAGMENLRGDLQGENLAKRFAARMREGAEGLADDSKVFARENPGPLGTGAALGLSLLLGWLFREKLTELVERYRPQIEEIAEDVSSDDE